jgi:hypothetical protein
MAKKQFRHLRLSLSRFVAVCAAALVLAILLGCMNICVDRSLVLGLDGVCKQEGTVLVPGGEELDVYYPVPFSSPPNLTTQSPPEAPSVIAQYPDHFRVKNTWAAAHTVEWVAKGVRGAPPGASPTPIASTKGLPVEPVPVPGQ